MSALPLKILAGVDGKPEWVDAPDVLGRVLQLGEVQRSVVEANAAKADVVANNIGGIGLEKGKKYVTSAELSALTDAISAASAPITTMTTQADINALASALVSATETFRGQIKTMDWDPPTNIANASWEQIINIATLSRGDPDAAYAIYGGQTKTFSLTSTTYGSQVTIRVADAGNMDRAAGGKCGLYFVVVDGLAYQQMNTANSTTGGYPAMPMHTTKVPAILATFPAELQEHFDRLKLHVHTQPSASLALEEVECEAHCVTMNQWFGEANLKNSYPTQTEWWKTEETWLRWNQEHDTNADRIVKNNSHSAYGAWTSSVYDSTNFGLVGSGGAPNYVGASVSYVPLLGFSLTNS